MRETGVNKILVHFYSFSYCFYHHTIIATCLCSTPVLSSVRRQRQQLSRNIIYIYIYVFRPSRIPATYIRPSHGITNDVRHPFVTYMGEGVIFSELSMCNSQLSAHRKLGLVF